MGQNWFLGRGKVILTFFMYKVQISIQYVDSYTLYL